MARQTLAAVLTLAVAVPAGAFSALPALQGPPKGARTPQPPVPPAAESADFGCAAAVVAASVLGLVAGLLAGPTAASAVSSKPRPEFQLQRPAYMQGIDASNAAISKGQVDFVTRSRMEALTFPEVRTELKEEQGRILAAPPKQERVQRQQQEMERLAAEEDIPA